LQRRHRLPAMRMDDHPRPQRLQPSPRRLLLPWAGAVIGVGHPRDVIPPQAQVVLPVVNGLLDTRILLGGALGAVSRRSRASASAAGVLARPFRFHTGAPEGSLAKPRVWRADGRQRSVARASVSNARVCAELGRRVSGCVGFPTPLRRSLRDGGSAHTGAVPHRHPARDCASRRRMIRSR
jgi:hypothetical protein